MLDLNLVRDVFPELSNIIPLTGASGQRDVCTAMLGTQKVALKIFKKTYKAEQRMEREVSAIVKLNLGCVPKIIDYGKRKISDEDALFVIEEWIEGKLLSDYFLEKQPLTFAESLEWGMFLLEACRDFEAKKIVHRDIKPNNIIWGTDGSKWILDFGIVRHLDLTSLTETAHANGLGTWGYGAPEQMRNIKINIDSRADLFSVGVVLYECLTGKNPYYEICENNLLILMKKMADEDLPALSILEDSDNKLSDFLKSLVGRFPSWRPQKAEDALNWFLPIYESLKVKGV